MRFFSSHKNGYTRGMTLVELVVVLAIFIVVSGLTMFEYQDFRSGASAQTLADDIALSVRKAQSFAIGVRNTNADFSSGFGVHFSVSSQESAPTSGSNKQFILFADTGSEPNKSYDYDSSSTSCDLISVSVGNECVEQISINSAEVISGIYLYGSSDAIGGSDPLQVDPNGSLDIVFLRPEPDAFFCYRTNLTSNLGSPCDTSSLSENGGISRVRIEISNPNIPKKYDETGNSIKSVGTKFITIWNTGYISIE